MGSKWFFATSDTGRLKGGELRSKMKKTHVPSGLEAESDSRVENMEMQ
jgi:hypothetical protein